MAISPKAKQLTSYLLADCATVYCRISKIKIIKLLYLIDVESVRRLGTKYTDIPWIFHLYGPYDSALDRYLSALGLEEGIQQEEFQTAGGKIGSVFKSILKADENDVKDPRVRRIAHDVVAQWAAVEINDLLNHVYFETEPMQNAAKGQALDFGTIQPSQIETPTVVKIDPEKLKALRTKLTAHKIGESFLPSYEKILKKKSESFFWDDPPSWRLEGECFFDAGEEG